MPKKAHVVTIQHDKKFKVSIIPMHAACGAKNLLNHFLNHVGDCGKKHNNQPSGVNYQLNANSILFTLSLFINTISFRNLLLCTCCQTLVLIVIRTTLN